MLSGNNAFLCVCLHEIARQKLSRAGDPKRVSFVFSNSNCLCMLMRQMRAEDLEIDYAMKLGDGSYGVVSAKHSSDFAH
jgi:hypothetical protein